MEGIFGQPQENRPLLDSEITSMMTSDQFFHFLSPFHHDRYGKMHVFEHMNIDREFTQVNWWFSRPKVLWDFQDKCTSVILEVEFRGCWSKNCGCYKSLYFRIHGEQEAPESSKPETRSWTPRIFFHTWPVSEEKLPKKSLSFFFWLKKGTKDLRMDDLSISEVVELNSKE